MQQLFVVLYNQCKHEEYSQLSVSLTQETEFSQHSAALLVLTGFCLLSSVCSLATTIASQHCVWILVGSFFKCNYSLQSLGAVCCWIPTFARCLNNSCSHLTQKVKSGTECMCHKSWAGLAARIHLTTKESGWLCKSPWTKGIKFTWEAYKSSAKGVYQCINPYRTGDWTGQGV